MEHYQHVHCLQSQQTYHCHLHWNLSLLWALLCSSSGFIYYVVPNNNHGIFFATAPLCPAGSMASIRDNNITPRRQGFAMNESMCTILHGYEIDG
jgi:hypothetical protein